MLNAGNLTPGATYIYEKADGVTYARKIGDPPSERFAIGYDYDARSLEQELVEARLWSDIHRAARTNPALQDALDRVKLIYALSKQDETPHHPV